jgi:hypothetical protein
VANERTNEESRRGRRLSTCFFVVWLPGRNKLDLIVLEVNNRHCQDHGEGLVITCVIMKLGKGCIPVALGKRSKAPSQSVCFHYIPATIIAYSNDSSFGKQASNRRLRDEKSLFLEFSNPNLHRLSVPLSKYIPFPLVVAPVKVPP